MLIDIDRSICNCESVTNALEADDKYSMYKCLQITQKLKTSHQKLKHYIEDLKTTHVCVEP